MLGLCRFLRVTILPSCNDEVVTVKRHEMHGSPREVQIMHHNVNQQVWHAAGPWGGFPV